MQTTNPISTSTVVNVSTVANQLRSNRKIICGLAVALLGSVAMVLSTAGTTQVPANLAASSIEGNIIVAFDTSARASKHTQYRIDCSAVNGGKVSAWAESAASPAVVVGLAAGEEYDCRASMKSDAGASKPVRVRVMGAD